MLRTRIKTNAKDDIIIMRKISIFANEIIV